MGFLYFVISFCHSLLPEGAETDHYCGSVSVGALELVHFLLSLSHSYDLYFLRAKLKYGMANITFQVGGVLNLFFFLQVAIRVGELAYTL